MVKFTRRMLLRMGSAAAAAAPFLPFFSSKDAKAETDSENVFHIFAFQWKPGTVDAQKERAAK